MTDRRELVLAMLASSEGRPFTPVQIQKAIFLVSRNVPGLINSGSPFRFVPYDYGPFDSDVYAEAQALQSQGLAVLAPSGTGNWNTYAASADGVSLGKQILTSLPPDVQDYMLRVSEWVRAQSFRGLVKSVYDAYPEMKVNSVFRG